MSSGLSLQVKAQLGRLALEVTLETGPGVLALVGPNGAGKSSLLAAVLGLLPKAQSEVWHDGAALHALPVAERRLGWVPQQQALMPHLNVRGNLAFALTCARLDQPEQRLAAVLAEFELDALADRPVGRLSGGERQRLALARALVVQPRALLLDEPFAALDVQVRPALWALVAERVRAVGVPTLLVTHDADEARTLADRVAVLENGRLSQLGTWQELAAAPASAYVAAMCR
jgi:molybdate transport system ATP-binding protein